MAQQAGSPAAGVRTEAPGAVAPPAQEPGGAPPLSSCGEELAEVGPEQLPEEQSGSPALPQPAGPEQLPEVALTPLPFPEWLENESGTFCGQELERPELEQQLQVDLSVTPPWRRIVQDTPAVEPEPIPDEGTHHAHPEDQASLTQPRVRASVSKASVSKASGPWAGQHESDGAFWKRHRHPDVDSTGLRHIRRPLFLGFTRRFSGPWGHEGHRLRFKGRRRLFAWVHGAKGRPWGHS